MRGCGAAGVWGLQGLQGTGHTRAGPQVRDTETQQGKHAAGPAVARRKGWLEQAGTFIFDCIVKICLIGRMAGALPLSARAGPRPPGFTQVRACQSAKESAIPDQSGANRNEYVVFGE